ncbi:helix-turn-helix transcriptional regulator [Parabacteroides sp.]|uniref:helix-turn-helix domain-containing protein n=1 Tax=Parabacteroides sp. TaxID=1869337 RepID=UPI001E0EF4A0|nr:helix-turn-helix transcriptional regulator [Parabacteroides sp.]MBS5485517.1 helix-turn-helix transcriptional regulator [Parabacteroides sp.]
MANLLIIKDLLKEKKISIRDFANELGMTEQALQLLIRKNSTKIETLELIAQKLNISVSMFFEKDIESKNNKPQIPYEFVESIIEERKRHDEERKRHDEMNAELIRQNGKLIQLLEESKKTVAVQKGDNASCADASGSGLVG